MADKKKFPNPAFFRARTEMDWKAQAANLKEVGSIAQSRGRHDRRPAEGSAAQR